MLPLLLSPEHRGQIRPREYLSQEAVLRPRAPLTCELFPASEGFWILFGPHGLCSPPRMARTLYLWRSQPSVTCLPVTNTGLALQQREGAAGVDQFLGNKDPVFMQTSSALKQKQILPRARPGCQVSLQDTFLSGVLRLRARLTGNGRRAVCQLPSVMRRCRTLRWNGNTCLEFRAGRDR